MRSPPCRGCKLRQAGCHAKCEQYASWKVELQEAKEKKISESFADGVRVEGYIKSKDDWRRSHKH